MAATKAEIETENSIEDTSALKQKKAKEKHLRKQAKLNFLPKNKVTPTFVKDSSSDNRSNAAENSSVIKKPTGGMVNTKQPVVESSKNTNKSIKRMFPIKGLESTNTKRTDIVEHKQNIINGEVKSSQVKHSTDEIDLTDDDIPLSVIKTANAEIKSSISVDSISSINLSDGPDCIEVLSDDEVPLSLIKKKLAPSTPVKSPLKSTARQSPRILNAAAKKQKKFEIERKRLEEEKMREAEKAIKRAKKKKEKLVKETTSKQKTLFDVTKERNGPMPTLSSRPLAIVSPMQAVKSVPAKNIIIAIDMDPEQWKRLSAEQQNKIIEEKKDLARKQLMAFGLTSTQSPVKTFTISPVRPITAKLVVNPPFKPTSSVAAVPFKPSINNAVTVKPNIINGALPNNIIRPAFMQLTQLYQQKRDDIELTGLMPLPPTKRIPMPDGFSSSSFSDIAMIVEFVNTFCEFLCLDETMKVTAARLMIGVCPGSEEAKLVSQILLLFLKVVLGNEDYKIPRIKMELADLPLTEYTVSFLVGQFIKSQLEKKKKQKRAEEIAAAAEKAAEKAELMNDNEMEIDEDDNPLDAPFILLSDDDDDDDDRQKKKKPRKKKDEFGRNSTEIKLKSIANHLENKEFYTMIAPDQLQVLTYLLNHILESEELSDYYEELSAEKHELYREVDNYRKEKSKIRKQKEEERINKEKATLLTLDKFTKKMPIEVAEDLHNKLNSTKTDQQVKEEGEIDEKTGEEEGSLHKEEGSRKKDIKDEEGKVDPYAGLTQRQIDVIKADAVKDLERKKEQEIQEREDGRLQEEENNKKLNNLIALCRKVLRLPPLGFDRYYRMYWLFTSGIPGLFVNGGNVLGSSCYSPSNETWTYYDSVEDIDKLISALTIRGVREDKLKSNLRSKYNDIASNVKEIKKSSDETVETTDKYDAFKSSVEALKLDVVESANRIVHGTLGELPELENWMENVMAVQDMEGLKEKILQIHSCIFPKYLLGSMDPNNEQISISTEWCKAIEKANTMSKLHTLYGVLENSVQWEKSAENMKCKVCRRKRGSNSADQLIICDICNLGYHSYCLRPALLCIPEGTWKCINCQDAGCNGKRGKMKEEPTSPITNDSIESDHEELCHVCESSGLMILCDTCPLSYHFECHDPPLRHAPRGSWSCFECRKPKKGRGKKYVKQITEEQMDDEDIDDLHTDEEDFKPAVRTHVRGPYKKKCNTVGNNTKNTTRKYMKRRKVVSTDSDTDTDPAYTNHTLKNHSNLRKRKHIDYSENDDNKQLKEEWTSPTLGNKRPRYAKDGLKLDVKRLLISSENENNSKHSSNKSKKEQTIHRPNSERSCRQASRNRRGNNYELSACKDILIGLRHDGDGWPFLSPVDVQEAPDYCDLIDTPMDFSLMMRKLDSLEYEDVLQFINDVNLIFSNSQKYNLETSEIGQAAVRLKNVFYSLVKEHLPEVFATMKVSE